MVRMAVEGLEAQFEIPAYAKERQKLVDAATSQVWVWVWDSPKQRAEYETKVEKIVGATREYERNVVFSNKTFEDILGPEQIVNG